MLPSSQGFQNCFVQPILTQGQLQKISQVKIGLKEFLEVLDYRMLGIFFKSILYYFIFAFSLCGIYLICIYNFNEAMWHEYFPVQDLSDFTDNEVLKEEL